MSQPLAVSVIPALKIDEVSSETIIYPPKKLSNLHIDIYKLCVVVSFVKNSLLLAKTIKKEDNELLSCLL